MITGHVLFVEDDANDRELTLAALSDVRLRGNIVSVCDGAEALDYLHCRGSYAGRASGDPTLVLLDLKLPKVDGTEVLREIKSMPRLRRIPVVVQTSSRHDLAECYELGVNAYVVKPVDFGQFVDTVRQLGLFWLLQNEYPPSAQ